MLKMLDLFSGIGGFSYAGEKLVGGYETVAFCEYDKHAQKVLRKHWPDTEIINDVRELANDADRFRGVVDIITGGYPCQPFSLSGVRRGDKDDRHLWPEMLTVIQKVRPTWVIGENVAGHITLGLDTVLSDLEAAGYASRCFIIPAVAANARHRRDRCWIVAHTDSQGQSDGPINEQRVVANTRGGRCERQPRRQSRVKFTHSDLAKGRFWEPEPAICRVVNGLPNRVHRVRQLGNSIVPQVAARILWAIQKTSEEN